LSIEEKSKVPMFLTLVLLSSYLVCSVTLQGLACSPFAKFFGDAPNHRKVHQTVIPRLGGLGMILALLIVLVMRTFVPGEIWPRSGNLFSGALLFIALFLAAAGTLDDVRTLGFKAKFTLQFILATGVVVVLGHKFGTVAVFGHTLELNYFGSVASIFWIVAVMNAFNIIDGIDGLAGCAALCGFSVVAFMAYASGATYLLAMSMVLIGLTLAFLRFNFSRKYKVFLGDSGSQFLGAVLALLAIEVQGMPKVEYSIFVPLLIVGYPLFDISVAMARRFFKRRHHGFSKRFTGMFVADNEHLHHRLVYLGLSHMQSTFLLFLVAGSLAASAVIISRVEMLVRIGVLAYLLFAMFLILNRLGFIGLRPWVTFPRAKAPPGQIVGIIDPDEVFFHSLKSFKQEKFEFLAIPGNVAQFMIEDLLAVLVYNATSSKFEEEWTTALRATEIRNCPAVVIADAHDIETVKILNPEGFRSVYFIEKPVRVPELIRMLENISSDQFKRKRAVEKFSLAELALKDRKNDGN
jgi:UDP-GlcNAc:undecaprenyl-phosphate GlcNAc-1-phosphate transferase